MSIMLAGMYSITPVCSGPAFEGSPARYDGGSWAPLLQFNSRCSWVTLAHFRFPSGVQWRAVWEMLSGSLLMTCPIHLHCLRMMMVPMLSWLQRARTCWLEMVSARTFAGDFTGFFWDSLCGRLTVCWGHFQLSSSILSRTIGWKVHSFGAVFRAWLWCCT